MTVLSPAPGLAADLELACQDAADWPPPGSGGTLRRWQRLSALAERDLVLARLVEAHADAVAILQELDENNPTQGRRYGVWAARGPALVLTDGRLHGVKDWCSGATLLTHALVTTSDGTLVDVDLDQPSVTPLPETWASAGMRGADTRSVRFDGAAARVVPGDYLQRPGFWAGGVGVASCWYGGMLPLLTPLRDHVSRHRDDALAAAHLGACLSSVAATRALLAETADRVDRGRLDMGAALRARSAVADTAALVLTRVGRALGPAPLARDVEHAQRVADLQVYIRQDHAERDLAALAVASLEQSWSL